jgi:hypothetical protein
MTIWPRRVALRIDAAGSIEDCAARLGGRLAHKPALAMISPRQREYVGRASADDVIVWATGPTDLGSVRFWHQWTPVFRGCFAVHDGSRTRLEGRISVNAFVSAFAILVVILIGGWLSAGVPYLVGRLREGSAIEPATWFANLILPIVFAGVFVLLYWYGGRLYERDRRELEAFLREALA